tara:strand:- start:4307 stop:4519 length:213 start_codon:yes stop_codon:yes gene_type:complete
MPTSISGDMFDIRSAESEVKATIRYLLGNDVADTFLILVSERSSQSGAKARSCIKIIIAKTPVNSEFKGK